MPRIQKALPDAGFLERLSAADQSLLAPALEEIALKQGWVIDEVGVPFRKMIFPAEGALLSSVTSIAGLQDTEIGIVGFEGFSASTALMGCERSPYLTTVQIPGRGHSVDLDIFREAMESSPTLFARCMFFAATLTVQGAYTATANARLLVEQRLARWLLMAHDRVVGHELRLTHEFLSVMLGVRRPGVTVALHSLEGRGLIRSLRAYVVVLDRVGLQELAGGTYGAAESLLISGA